MITPSFGLTATERVLPRLALDFTTASLDPRVTFTRAGNTATTVNSSGVIVGVNADIPRFDYGPITLACKGLLIEELRQNIVLYSEKFDNAYWFKNRSSISLVDAAVAPDGTTTADLLIENTSVTITHYLRREFTSVSGTTYTWSIFLKNETRRYASLKLGDDGVAFATNLTRVDLLLGTIIVSNAESANITAFSNGWYRVDITMTAIASLPSAYVYVYLDNGTTNIYTGNGTSGFYVWGAQLEIGAFPTSYIPTVAATVTRNADVATMTGANFSDWYNASEGAAVIQALPSTISNTRPAIRFDDNTANESIALRGVAADPQLFVVDGGSTQATLDAGTITANTVYKLGGAWKASSFATAINGAAAVTSASGTLPTVTQARLGSDGTNYFNGHLQNLRYWPQRLTNAEVQAFSK
jgi:hypothetical protein